jgi:selenide,water dikinase
MSRLNRSGARLMHKYNAHGATDVTGFGILGHGKNLANNQKKEVDFIIHTLPIIDGMREADEKVNHMFKLIFGLSAETSGTFFMILLTPRWPLHLLARR